MIEIDLRLEEDLKLVDEDPVEIEQVLMNLAVNARDAMPDGGRLVIMTANRRRPEKHSGTQSTSPSQDWVLLTKSPSDTGHGMDKDTLEQIFEPFFSTKAPGKGTGLGLSMVHGIVKNHDSRITCRSTPGKVTSFRIYLPEVKPGMEKKPVERKKEYQVGNETILLVDDEEAVRQTGKVRLERAGYTVLTASGGEMALGVIGRKRLKSIWFCLISLCPGWAA